MYTYTNENYRNQLLLCKYMFFYTKKTKKNIKT